MSDSTGDLSILKVRIAAIIDFLTQPLPKSILATHPNDLLPDFTIGDRAPECWDEWWCWATDETRGDKKWLQLVRYHNEGKNGVHATHDGSDWSGIPRDLVRLIDAIKTLQLDRACQTSDANFNNGQEYGMSPKKSHEVNRMASFTRDILGNLRDSGMSVKHIVDVGAGQGYLTRALASLPVSPPLSLEAKGKENSMRLLALDYDNLQTEGAEKWVIKAQKYRRKKDKGRLPPGDRPLETLRAHEDEREKATIDHKTIHITSNTLVTSVDEWLQTTEIRHNVPVLFVALHACGSLSPDILRAFLATSSPTEDRKWRPVGGIIVGCCYNLLSPSDFPLSRYILARDTPPLQGLPLPLPLSYLQLAAQIPSTWFLTPKSISDVKLAIKKVTWRAIVGSILSQSQSHPLASQTEPLAGGRRRTDHNVGGTGETLSHRRLGKIPDRVYNNWDEFLKVAGDKMGASLDPSIIDNKQRKKAESRLEILHVLRCLLGPVVESLIILDRLLWLKEEVTDEGQMNAELVNLFDQSTGSGRNVAIVIKPPSGV